MRRLLLLLTAAAMVWACTTQLQLPGGLAITSTSPTPTTSPSFTPTAVKTPTPVSTTLSGPHPALNYCFAVVGSAGVGTVTIHANTEVAAATELLLLQMGTTMVFDTANLPTSLGAGAIGQAGIFDLRLVAAIAKAGTNELLTLDNALSAAYGKDGPAQVCTIPYFATLTVDTALSAVGWDPTAGAGGVLAIRADNLIASNGSLSADGAGYPGGKASGQGADVDFQTVSCDPGLNPGGAFKGGSLAVPPRGAAGCAGQNWTGGGGGNEGLGGGGGGSGGGAGGAGGGGPGFLAGCSGFEGGPCGTGGIPFLEDPALDGRLFLGGGGGGGDGSVNGGAGGNGGGIILLLVTSSLSGSPTAEGLDGGSAAVFPGGGGGGGAGGTIRIDAARIVAGAITVDGGSGGDSGGSVTSPSGPGGGGGGGRILYGGVTTAVGSANPGSFGIVAASNNGALVGTSGFGISVTPLPPP